MLSLEIVSEFMYEYFEGIKESKNGNHFHARCPLCGDSKKSLSKKRFHLDYNGGNPGFHCFNCGECGSFLELYSTIKGITINQAKKELFTFDPDYLTRHLSQKKKKKIIKEIGYEYHDYILDDCITLNTKPEGYQQLQYKKLLGNYYNTRKIPKTFKIFIAYKGYYKNRYIIPVYDEHKNIVYFQARRIHEEMLQKYANPTLTKGNIILNKHKFNKDKYIIITEGLIDAFMVENNQGTSCLGSSITEHFIEQIYPLTDKGVIVVMDNDKTGKNELIKLLNSTNKYKRKLKYFLLPNKYKCKDINEVLIKYNIKDIYSMVMENSFSYEKTEVLLKLNVVR